MPLLTIFQNAAKKWDEYSHKWVHFEEFMKLYLISLYSSNPVECVCVRSLGLPEEKKEIFLGYNPNVSFEDEPDTEVKGKELWAYLREIEFRWWKSKLESHPEETFIHTDNDLLFRGSIQEMYDLMESADVGFAYSPDQQDRSKYNKGVFAVRGPGGLQFIKDWETASQQAFREDRDDGWYTTQLSAFYTLSAKKYRLVHFPNKYHDSVITPSGIIWHANRMSKNEKLLSFQRDLGPKLKLL